MVEELAAIESTPAAIADSIRRAALYAEGNQPHEQMFVQVDSDRIETPASAADASQTSYCTIYDHRFDALQVREPVTALFDVEEVLGWLDWFDGDGSIRMALRGDPGAEVCSQLVIENERRTVTLACVDDPAILQQVDRWLPDRFENGTYHDEHGDPLPTRIQTTAADLQELVAGVEALEDATTYPVVAIDGRFLLELHGEQTTVEATLSGDVSGPDVRNQYGDGFARVARGVDGDVTLQTSPGGDLVVVGGRPGAVVRHYVSHHEP